MSKKVLWITRTAVLIALLVIMQMITSSFGNTIVTGSIVNLILIISVMTSGLSTGLSVALVSPIFAKLLNIGPLWTLIPFIMLGNMVLVITWYIIGNNKNLGKKFTYPIALVTGAVIKFGVLYIGVVKIAIPILTNLPEKKATVISATFSVPQLITALVGGVLACIILPIIKPLIKMD